MKTISLQVSDKYNWLCQQPDGAYLLSRNKPVIIWRGDYYDEEALIPSRRIEFWGMPNALALDCEIDTDLEGCENWRESLVELK